MRERQKEREKHLFSKFSNVYLLISHIGSKIVHKYDALHCQALALIAKLSCQCRLNRISSVKFINHSILCLVVMYSSVQCT